MSGTFGRMTKRGSEICELDFGGGWIANLGCKLNEGCCYAFLGLGSEGYLGYKVGADQLLRLQHAGAMLGRFRAWSKTITALSLFGDARRSV